MREGAAAGASPSSRARFGLTLGLLSAVGPLAIDLYLPALPTMMHELGAAPGELQRTLSVYFFALAAAQIPLGSLSDRLGRKPVIYAGFTLFIIACLACALARSVESLVALRFAQGFGVCAGTIVSRAMIRDIASGPQAARLMATSFLVIGISPVLAPLLGSYLLHVVSWRGLFVLLACAGVAGIALARLALPESLPVERRIARGTPLLPAYAGLLKNGNFMRASLVAALATTIPFSFVTAAPFVLSGHFGLGAREYSLLLGLNALCSIGSMQLGPSLMKQWGAKTVLVRTGVAGSVVCACMAAALSAGFLGLLAFQLGSLVIFALAGIALTPAAITALDASSSGAGTSASALGTIQMVVTGTASAAISLLPSFSVVPLLTIVGLSFLGAFLLSERRGAACRIEFSPRA